MALTVCVCVCVRVWGEVRQVKGAKDGYEKQQKNSPHVAAMFLSITSRISVATPSSISSCTMVSNAASRPSLPFFLR